MNLDAIIEEWELLAELAEGCNKKFSLIYVLDNILLA